MLDRKKMTETVKAAADKAGTLVTAALAISGVALLVAFVALILAGKARHAG